MLLHFLDASKFHSLQDFEADFSDFSHGDQVYLTACVCYTHNKNTACKQLDVQEGCVSFAIPCVMNCMKCTLSGRQKFQMSML